MYIQIHIVNEIGTTGLTVLAPRAIEYLTKSKNQT